MPKLLWGIDIPFAFALHRLASPGETPANDRFVDQPIRGDGGSDADSEVEFPVVRNIQIEAGKKLLLLLAHGIKTGNGTASAVVFKADAKSVVRLEDAIPAGRRRGGGCGCQHT